MPISDLLASITGEKPAPSASTPSKPLSVAPKRKADNELPGVAAKKPHTGSVADRASRPNGSSYSTSRLPERPLASASTNTKPTSTSRPGDKSGTPAITKPSQHLPYKPVSSSSFSNGTRNGATGSAYKPSSAASSGSNPPQKKKSFKEIMERAAAAQQSMKTNVGKIQHKTIERGMTKRERTELKAEEARAAAKLARKAAGSRPGGKTNGASSSPAKGANGKPTKRAPVEEVKKVKKAALATTGYTGTARPRPGASSSKPNGSASKVGPDARPRERPLYGGPLSSSRRRYEDEDDDLDDFIEYDDEEEPPYGARPGGYDSVEEDESDMEAGLTDIDEEERRAEMVARREDSEQEKLERRLKQEKEEKKRRMEAAAARKRS